ncbi:MAG: hypothetical protein LUQ32_09205 [Methanomicrobiales archaeon]|nr:hypothetical protein [Methanomicrobiales archaeon]
MHVFTLIEHGTEFYSIAIYIGGLTRFYLRVKHLAINAGMIWRPGLKGVPPQLLPFLRIGDPERPLVRLGV